jgi:hypothetical protein
MIIETFDITEEPSMDNPPIETFPHLEIGDSFVFKGEYVKVHHISKSKTGFWYMNPETLEQGFMSFQFYMSTPSAKGRRL